MKTQALVCTEDQTFQLAGVDVPDADGDQVLVRTLYSGVSIGTEFALVHDKIRWGPFPICTGYQGVGVIEQVGPDASRFSCGDTVYYRASAAGMTWDGRAVSCVAGTHAAHAVVGENQDIELLPVGADPALSSTFVMPAVGLHGTDLAGPRMGDLVVVSGVGLIGLGVVAACSQRGCRVVAVDVDAGRLSVAAQLGADVLIDASSRDVAAEVAALAPAGADAVFEATGKPELLTDAMLLCRDHGKFVWQGNYGQAPFPYEFMPAHTRHLTMFHPCNDGEAPCRAAVIRNMARGLLPWERTITHRIEADQAPAAFDAINHGNANNVLGAIIHWS